MKRILLVPLLCMAGAADCQTLYRCARSGVDSYQQSPCPPSSTTVNAIEVVPEPAPTDDERRQRRERAEQGRAESAFLSHQAGTDFASAGRRATSYRASRGGTSGRTSATDRCRAAKEASKAVRKAMGLERTYEALRQLDGGVRDACGSD